MTQNLDRGDDTEPNVSGMSWSGLAFADPVQLGLQSSSLQDTAETNATQCAVRLDLSSALWTSPLVSHWKPGWTCGQTDSSICSPRIKLCGRTTATITGYESDTLYALPQTQEGRFTALPLICQWECTGINNARCAHFLSKRVQRQTLLKRPKEQRYVPRRLWKDMHSSSCWLRQHV